MRISDWSSDVCSSDLLSRNDDRARFAKSLSGAQILKLAAPIAAARTRCCRFSALASIKRTSVSSRAIVRGSSFQKIGRIGRPARKSVGEVKRVSVSVELGGRRIIKQKNKEKYIRSNN